MVSVSGDDDDLPTCECGQTMTIEKGTIPMWRCNICEELKASVLKYTCACGRSVCDECAWLNCGEEIEEEWEEDYEEWDECCEIGASNFWNGCDQYQHQEEEQWQDWDCEASPEDWEEYGEYGQWNEYCEVGAQEWSGCDQDDEAVAKYSDQLPTLLTEAQKATQELKAALNLKDCDAAPCDEICRNSIAMHTSESGDRPNGHTPSDSL